MEQLTSVAANPVDKLLSKFTSQDSQTNFQPSYTATTRTSKELECTANCVDGEN